MVSMVLMFLASGTNDSTVVGPWEAKKRLASCSPDSGRSSLVGGSRNVLHYYNEPKDRAISSFVDRIPAFCCYSMREIFSSHSSCPFVSVDFVLLLSSVDVLATGGPVRCYPLC